MNRTNAGNTANDRMPELTLRDILAPLFRHRRIAIISFSGVFLCVICLAWFWAARYYVAKMQVVVEQDRSDPAVTAAQNAQFIINKGVSIDQISSEVALLQGQDMLRNVVTECALVDDNDWSVSDIFMPKDPALRGAMKREKAAVGLGKTLTVEAEKTSDVINVSYGKTGNPQKPACVLQTLGKLYLQKHLQLQRPTGSTSVFVEEAEKSRKALDLAETRLANFSREEGIAAPEILRTDMAQQLTASEAALYQAQQTISAHEQRIKNITRQLAATPPRSSTTEVSNSSNLLMQQLQASLLAAQLKRTQLLLKYDPAYRLVLEADQEITETQEAIAKAQDSKYVDKTTDRDPTYEYLRQDLAKTQADLASQKATAAALINSNRSMQVKMVKLDEQAVRQSALIREAKANETSYLLYLSKREQERTSDALDSKKIANVAIAVPAEVPLVPAHSPLSVMMLGFFFAIFIGIATAFGAEYLDPSFRTPAEVLETLRIPVLAAMPRKAA